MIPRTIHRFWIGGEEPEWSRPFRSSWEREGWTLRQWTEEELRDELFPLRNQALFDAADKFTHNSAGQMRGDLIRYELLHRFGGVYVDCDLECLKPIDPLIEGIDGFIAQEGTGNKRLNNAILGFGPGEPFLDRLIASAIPHAKRMLSRRGAKSSHMTGPGLITRVWERWHDTDIRVYPAKWFYPLPFTQANKYAPGKCDPAELWPEAYTMHWWASQRTDG